MTALGRMSWAAAALAIALAGAFGAATPSLAQGGDATASVPDAPNVKRTYAYLLDDEELNRAIDYARYTLTRFVSIHQSRNEAPEKLEFMIRAAVDDGAGGYEYRWLENIVIEPDAAISGDLNTEGGAATSLKPGERFRAEPDAIVDWAIFTESGGIVGGYTTRVDVSRADEKTKALYQGRFLN